MAPDAYLINDLFQLRSLASAMRQDIVDAVAASGPITVAALAERMGRPADSLYHHVRHLAKRGLLAMSDGEQGIGRPAAVLDVPGRPMLIQYDTSSKANAKVMFRVLGAMLSSARRGFVAAFRPDSAVVSGPRRNLWAARYHCWLTPSELEEVNRLLSHLSTVLINGATRRTNNSHPHEFTYILSPVRVDERVAKNRK